MKEKSSIQYFQESFRKWLAEQNITQAEAGRRLSISTALVNALRSGKKGLSFEQADIIAKNMRTTLEEMIIRGKKLLGDDPETEGLTPEQIQALEAFKFCMLEGGEGIEIITQTVLDLAEKKRTETEVQNNTLEKMKTA